MADEEKDALHNSCSQWETEVDRLKFNAVELRRRLEDSQAALHELGRENQSLQVPIFNKFIIIRIVVRIESCVDPDGKRQITRSQVGRRF